jgi:hypothetical protein
MLVSMPRVWHLHCLDFTEIIYILGKYASVIYVIIYVVHNNFPGPEQDYRSGPRSSRS